MNVVGISVPLTRTTAPGINAVPARAMVVAPEPAVPELGTIDVRTGGVRE